MASTLTKSECRRGQNCGAERARRSCGPASDRPIGQQLASHQPTLRSTTDLPIAKIFGDSRHNWRSIQSITSSTANGHSMVFVLAVTPPDSGNIMHSAKRSSTISNPGRFVRNACGSSNISPLTALLPDHGSAGSLTRCRRIEHVDVERPAFMPHDQQGEQKQQTRIRLENYRMTPRLQTSIKIAQESYRTCKMMQHVRTYRDIDDLGGERQMQPVETDDRSTDMARFRS